MGVVSLVLGIISLCVSIFSAGSLGIVGTICAILGIVFGALGKKNPETEKMAKAGLICSIIALCIGLLLFIICTGAVGCLAASSY